MNICNSCKFYVNYPEHEKFGECMSNKIHVDIAEIEDDDLCFSVHGETLGARKIVGENFGCIHHESE